MGQVLPGSATTTAAVRRAIQHSRESMRVLGRRHGINPKTIAKWKNVSPPRIAGPAPPFAGRPFYPWNKKPSSSPFASTPSCRSMTACMPCRLRSRSSFALRFIVVLSAMASADCPRSRGTSLAGRSSTHIQRSGIASAPRSLPLQGLCSPSIATTCFLP